MTRARSELRESNPRLRFVGPRPSHWTKLGYRQWVLAPPIRAYETQLRAGAAGVAPTRGVEPLEPAFVAPVPIPSAWVDVCSARFELASSAFGERRSSS